MEIRQYAPPDEEGWLRCRVLSFLHSPYYDDVYREKETYRNPAIELVAVEGEEVVGLIDVELDTPDRSVCSGRPGGGMIWHLAVHPDHQRDGIATELLDEAGRRARSVEVTYLEAWTRDDPAAVSWYRARGFDLGDSYLHVYLSAADADGFGKQIADGLRIQAAFAHYVGEEADAMREAFDRVHDCQQFVLAL